MISIDLNFLILIQLLHYDFSCVPLYRSNHCISAVKGLEHKEAFSASRLPKQSVARNIATTGIDKQCERKEHRFPWNALISNRFPI